MSDTSGQDGSGQKGGVMTQAQQTVQVPLQKLIQLVAQMHGGQQPGQSQMPMPGMVGGQQQSNIQPGTFQSPQGSTGAGGAMLSGPQDATTPGNLAGAPQGGPSPQGLAPPPFNQQAPGTGKTNPTLTGPYALPPQGGGTPGQGQGSAPPPGSAGQRVFPQAQMGQPLGAPQLPQGGGQMLQQAPFSGGGGGAPWQAAPIQDYGSFLKAYPMPKAPTWEDAVGVAEELRQNAGMKGPGQGDPLGTSPGLVGSVMDKMNEQYEKQMGHHAAAFTGQLGAAHAHNQYMAEQERARHDRATEKNQADAVSGKGTAAAASNETKKSALEQHHQETMDRISQGAQRIDALREKLANEKDASAKKAIQAQINEEDKNIRSALADRVNLQNGPNAGSEEGKKLNEELKNKGGGTVQSSQGNGQPVPVKTPEEAKKLPSGTKIQLPDGRIGTVP